MRDVSLWRALLGVEKTVIERVEFDEDAELLVAHVRATARARSRCGVCGRRCPGYDHGQGRRRWRSLDLGTMRAVLEADAPRVRCPQHGVVVASVPWARHDAGHTYAFDETVAWLTTRSSKSTVTELMRIAWRTVGSIITRVWADVEAKTDRFANLRRIGIDEISYKKGHKYLMVVVDHDARRLVWGQNRNFERASSAHRRARLAVYRLDNPLQRYAWGSWTVVQEPLGLEVDGQPIAEMWLGGHHAAPSSVVGGARNGATLPYLLKVLAADEPLSLQVHPSAEQAREGFCRRSWTEVHAPRPSGRSATTSRSSKCWSP